MDNWALTFEMFMLCYPLFNEIQAYQVQYKTEEFFQNLVTMRVRSIARRVIYDLTWDVNYLEDRILLFVVD
jgi:hypothetical protein